MTKHTETAGQYPVIPLRTEVQLPGHVGPLEIGREASVRAIEAANRIKWLGERHHRARASRMPPARFILVPFGLGELSQEILNLRGERR